MSGQESSGGKLDEVLEQSEADVLALFRMKLRGENVFFPDCRCESLAVTSPRRNDGCIHRFGKKAMDEIDVAAAGNPAKEGALRMDDLELVPADLRNLEAVLLVETDDFAREMPK